MDIRLPLRLLSVLAVAIVALPLAAGLAVGADDSAVPPSFPDDAEPTVAPAQENGEAKEHDVAQEPPQRVVLRVSRNREVAGYLQLEDDDVIVIRTRAGGVESFPKLRVLQIIRLVNPVPTENQPGQPGFVLLNNGQRRDGIIVEDHFDHVVIETNGIRSTLKREIVDRVVLEPPFEQRYAAFRDSLSPGMYERHLILCRWLIEQRRYDLARENLLEILGQREIPEARRLLNLVDLQLELLEKAADREPAPRPRRTNQDWEPPGGIISQADVNLIRVYELDFDHPPRVNVSHDTIRKLIAQYGTHPLIPVSQTERNQLFRADSLDIVRLMFEMRARDLYHEIQVLSEPAALNFFRQRVHDPYLINKCATSGCHGGPDAGSFFLHRQNPRDERVRYTNLLILERLDVNPQWPLINYEQPEMSLIVQYGLPRSQARLPHPDVPGWKPVFRRTDDRQKLDVQRWISSMMQPRPVYPVEYQPPRLEDERSSPPPATP